MTDLFSPIKIGPLALSHRVVMAPLTRMRSEPGDKPGKLMQTYYDQRASEGGLIIGEATVASPNGNGYLGSPGLYSDDQTAGWRTIVDTVHAKGGRIFLQLFHAGRQSHVDMQPDGGAPVAPSALDYEGVAFTADGWVPSSPARALSEAEVADMVLEFRRAAERGLTAGFDGVELHGANGYLIDQFLQDNSNQRTDAYGGTIEKRARFLLDIVRETIAVWGSDRSPCASGPAAISAT
ncbi:MAG: alkene reductase [Rhizobacter sp.]|nr:alkene reductase [Rhizobacter sp.]